MQEIERKYDKSSEQLLELAKDEGINANHHGKYVECHWHDIFTLLEAGADVSYLNFSTLEFDRSPIFDVPDNSSNVKAYKPENFTRYRHEVMMEGIPFTASTGMPIKEFRKFMPKKGLLQILSSLKFK